MSNVKREEIAIEGASPPSTPSTSVYKPLRIWPAVVLLVLMVVARNLPGWWENGPSNLWMSAAFGPALAAILVFLWWVIGSRASWKERLLGFVVMVGACVGIMFLLDPTMQGPGAMVLTIPLAGAAFAIGTILFSRVLSMKRTVLACLFGILASSTTLAMRTDGMWGNFGVSLQPRWAATTEQRIAERKANTPSVQLSEIASPDLEANLAQPAWPGFRGPQRNGKQQGTALKESLLPEMFTEVWRIPVGPGWSSFVVAGNLLWTQEQRGEQESILCYAADTGREVWVQQTNARFDDPLGGPGPRATPTLAEGFLYVMGAMGDVLKLDPKSGEILWKQDLRTLAERSPPMWGFSSSPLIVEGKVIVYAGGKEQKGLFAFDAQSGDVVWSAPAAEHSYSSAQLETILGEEYILLTTNTGLDLFRPSTGELACHVDSLHEGYRATQPLMIDEASLLLAAGMGTGTAHVTFQRNAEGQLSSEILWSTLNMKPDFSDLVSHDGFAYGFDNNIFSCIDLKTGQRKWKGGRYGKGQVLLLEDSGMLLVATETGSVVLIKATSNSLEELVTISAIEGRTWNHPVVVGDRLYLRNSQEAVCYQLPVVTSEEMAAR